MDIYELLENVDNVLRMHGFRVQHIRYPDEPSRRSIDVIAVGDEGELLVKVVNDVDMLTGGDLRELNACGSVLGASALVVAEAEKGDEIDPMVAIEKGGAFVVGVEGLESALRGSVYVIRRQSNYYMRVDGRRLRERRLEKGYSLGDVASMLSVSRRSIYLYEQEESLVSLPVALKLMELFGDDIFKPFDIMHGEEQGGREGRTYAVLTQSASRTQLARILASMGYSVVATRRIPPDIVASKEGRRKDRLIVVVERKREVALERRLEEATRVAAHIEAEVVAMTKRREIASSYDVEIVGSVNELKEYVDEKRRSSGTLQDA